MKHTEFLVIVIWFIGCVRSGEAVFPEFLPSRVLERVADHDDTPAWSTGQIPFFEEHGDIIYVNTLSMSGDARPEACTKAAGDLGRVQILRQVRESITASGQYNEVSASSDPAVETLIAFLSQGTLSGVKIVGRYWERREESDAHGLRVLRIYCAAKVAISRRLLDQQMRAAIDGGSGGDLGVRQKLLNAQKNFIDSVAPPFDQSDRETKSSQVSGNPDIDPDGD